MSMKANNIILHVHLPDPRAFRCTTHARLDDNAGQIRILFFPAGAAMKSDSHNKPLHLGTGPEACAE